MSHPVDIAAGKQLRSRRGAKLLSRVQFVAAAGISAQQVERYENAENRMSASRMQGFADVLQVHPAFFFENGKRSLLQAMADALRFYADATNYQPQPHCVGNATSVDFDNHGSRARSVLAKAGHA